MAESTESMCQRRSTRCLRIPLKSTEQIYLVFILPILVSCAIYITNFAADLVVAVQHFRAGNPFWAISTIFLMYAPALVYFALTVSRPDWWMTEDEKIADGVAAWFAVQLLQLLAFPFFALYRYASVIVLAVDATMLRGEDRRKSLDLAAAPAAIELYFFLRAWFQAAPQAVFQTHLLFREYTMERTHQTVIVHALCITMSIVVLSMETASFQRFESQRVNGRQLPWATWLKKYRERDEPGDKDEKRPLRMDTTMRSSSTTTSATNCAVSPQEVAPLSAPLIAEPTANNREAANFQRQISTTPPLPPKNVQVKPPPAPIRGITTVVSLPIPEMPAPPRPDSIVRDLGQGQGRDLDQGQGQGRDLDQGQGRDLETRLKVTEESFSSPAMTTKKWRNLRIPKRKYSVKGLEEDDPIGKFVAFVWWFFFVAARVLAIAVFYEFYPYWLLAVITLHYVLTIAYIFYNAKYNDATNVFLTLWLGSIYVFSVIEYRVKFKRADTWLLAYYTFVIGQNSIITVVWFVYGDWTGFWYTYAFTAIFVFMALCIMSAGVYSVLFKPKKRRVYAS